MPKIYSKKCDFCNIFYKSSARKFCSVKCYGKWLSENPYKGGKVSIKCITCKNIFKVFPYRLINRKVVCCSRKCVRGNGKTYSTIHKWMTRNYGKALMCEMKNCKRISFKYDWALLKGKKYTKKRSNFFQLCKSCHMIYDKINCHA